MVCKTMDMSSKNNPSMQNIKDTTSNFNQKYKKKMRSVSDRIM